MKHCRVNCFSFLLLVIIIELCSVDSDTTSTASRKAVFCSLPSWHPNIHLMIFSLEIVHLNRFGHLLPGSVCPSCECLEPRLLTSISPVHMEQLATGTFSSLAFVSLQTES